MYVFFEALFIENGIALKVGYFLVLGVVLIENGKELFFNRKLYLRGIYKVMDNC